MRTDNRFLLKALSLLFRFPDKELIGVLPSLKVELQRHSPGKQFRRCCAFMDYLENNSHLKLQEEFSRIFDFSNGTSLNITYHRWGESRERGSALSGLIELYRDSGYEISGGELPDYLPLILEFLSVCEEDVGLKILLEWGDQVEKLAERISQCESPYSLLMETLCELFADSNDPERQEGHG